MSDPAPMETMRDAVARLRSDGFDASFHARREGLEQAGTERVFAPEDLIVEEVVRFEGESDPGDEAVLFALRSADGAVRGTFASNFGASVEPNAAEAMRRLEWPAHDRRSS